MKLDRFTSGVVAASAALMLTFASGCTPAAAPPAPRTTASALQSSADANVTGTTNLMSAQMAGPAPRVGKSRLAGSAPSASDESESDIEVGSTGADGASGANAPLDRDSELPKGARRSDGSRRGGGFGSSK